MNKLEKIILKVYMVVLFTWFVLLGLCINLNPNKGSILDDSFKWVSFTHLIYIVLIGLRIAYVMLFTNRIK